MMHLPVNLLWNENDITKFHSGDLLTASYALWCLGQNHSGYNSPKSSTELLHQLDCYVAQTSKTTRETFYIATR